jgi:hypothetical protein
MDRFELCISEDKTNVSLRVMQPDGESSMETLLSLEELRILIDKLGKAHAGLAEGQPLPLTQIQTIPTVVNPIWRVESVLRGILFAFYHPAYGPLGFTMSTDQISKMVGILLRQLDEDIASLSQTPS